MKNSFLDAINATKHIESKEVSVSEDVALYLYNSAKLVEKRDVIVESGAFMGYSTIFLGFGSFAGNGVKVHSIDPWGLPPSSLASRMTYHDKLNINSKTFDKFLYNIEKVGLENIIVPHRAYAHIYNRVWPRNLTIGLLFIDGDHSEWGAYVDFFLYSKYLSNGATVIFHDFGAKSVERAVSRIDKFKIRNRLIFGTGYLGREAFAFKYIKSGGKRRWLNKFHYYELSFINYIKKNKFIYKFHHSFLKKVMSNIFKKNKDSTAKTSGQD